MLSIVQELLKHDYNPDGSMKLKRREELRTAGWDEDEINNLEQIHIRNAEIDRKQAEWEKELQRQIAESNAQEEQERRQRAEREGIPYKPLPISNGNNANMQTRVEAMAGLDREELINQGFLEADDYYNPRQESTSSSRSNSKPKKKLDYDPNWEPEGGWIDF